ncbi:hypothetical protein N7507_011063 [Penicillium longicatenatum]|nr:hypothetical protein N7507_011063 [Penicillium longicatenatum]
MRTRSQPLSPGGYQSLDDLPARRRATRSASSAEPTTESQPEAAKTRKAEAKKRTTTKKTTRRPRSKVAKSTVPDTKQTSPALSEQPKALVMASADEQDIRALGPQNATPIMRRRPRVPYASITARRRSNAGGRVVNTLFQLESLVNQSSTTESAATDNEEETVPVARDPATPEPNIPTTPKTAPAASTGASPSWSRRIINNVSSRWSSFRGRISPRKSGGSQDLVAEATAPSTSTTHVVASRPEETGVSTEMEMAAVPMTPVAAASTPRRSSLSRTRRPRAPSFDYSARPGGGFSKDTLDKCYARSRTLPPSGFRNEALDALASELGNKRKRESPESIPNPPGCSYGMHEDYFTYDDDDEVWAEEEKAQRAAAAAKAAEAANEETVQPPLKKQRVAQEPDQTRRRHILSRQTPRKAESRPGYDRNRPTRLYQATHLPTIESSDFLSEGSHGPDVTKTRPNINTAPFTANTQGTFQTPGWDSSPSSSDDEDYPSSGPQPESTTTPTGMYQAMPSSPNGIFPVSSPAPRTFRNPNPHGTFRTPYSSDDEDDMDVDMDMDSPPNSNIAGADPMDEDTSPPARTNDTTTETPTQNDESALPATDPSPLTRVRNKAQQFKPKTPSRLREASRFSTGSANSSPPTINETRATLFPPPHLSQSPPATLCRLMAPRICKQTKLATTN